MSVSSTKKGVQSGGNGEDNGKEWDSRLYVKWMKSVLPQSFKKDEEYPNAVYQ